VVAAVGQQRLTGQQATLQLVLPERRLNMNQIG
jgi:hypothetical protein